MACGTRWLVLSDVLTLDSAENCMIASIAAFASQLSSEALAGCGVTPTSQKTDAALRVS